MILYAIFDIVFFGFGVYSFYFLLLKWFPFWKNNPVFAKIDDAAVTVVRIIGVLYFLVWLYDILSILYGNDSEAKNNFLIRLNGPYSFSIWLHAVMYLIATQLLYFKKIAQIGITRFVIALLLFVNFEKYVIIVTSIHRDYLPSSWSMIGGDFSFFGWLLLDWVMKLFIFASLVAVTYYLKSRKSS